MATTPTNMHLSFDRLAALARDVLQPDPLSGHLFAFFNRGADRVKILLGSLWLLPVVQAAGAGRVSSRAGAPHLELDAADLMLLLDGIDLGPATRHPRFTPRVSTAGERAGYR